MKIEGINSQNIISAYGGNKDKAVAKVDKTKSNDRIEISNLGKTLNNYSLEGLTINRNSNIEEIKAKIENGTYNIDAKLTAQSIIDTIKGDKI